MTKQNELKEIALDLLDRWSSREEDMINEHLYGRQAIAAEKALKLEVIDYKERIENSK
jgi:hypothetical protein